jgi:hypothetical protein
MPSPTSTATEESSIRQRWTGRVRVNKYMNKTALVLALVLAPSISILVFQFSFVAANPIGAYFPHDPHTLISVKYPENGMQFSVRTITLRFSLNLSLWYPDYLSEYNPSYSCNVSSIQYYLDGEFAGDLTEIPQDSKFISLSTTLDGLADGEHSLEIKTTTNGRYWHQVGGFEAGDTPAWDDSDAPIYDSSGLVNFTIKITSPSVSVLSPVNKTYDVSDVPLSFTVKEPISQINYSLDGKEDLLILGNTTLTGLANGDHNLTVYAKDEAGNIGVSKTIFFSIKVPEPFPTTLAATVSGASIAVIALGLLVYLKKRHTKSGEQA